MSDDRAVAALGVARLADAYRSGDLAPVEALMAYIARIERLNPRINAFLDLRIRAARDEAIASGERWRRGAPLSAIDGAPFGVKANIGVEGLPLHAGVGAWRDNIAKGDAACVVRLKAAGAIPVGILNMHEGALGATTDNPHFGRCCNPWNADWTPGGSSGGSAAAVATGLCAFSLGTDTMGSVRIPSAYCGVVGVKPSKGVVSDAGLLDLSPTLDHVGVHAAALADALPVLAALGLDRSASPPRIGVGRWGHAIDADVDAIGSLSVAAESLRAMAAVIDIDISGFDFGALRRKGLLVSEIEGHAVHASKLKAHRDGFSEEFAGSLEWGARQPREKRDDAYRALRDAAAGFDHLFERVECIVLPTAPQGPFPFSTRAPANQADFTCIANFGGFPAVSVPVSVKGEPPRSIQFIARRGNDGAALAAAAAFEARRGPAPRPPLFDA